MKYAIFPPIAIGRVGNSPSHFFSPETAGSRGTELATDGSEQEVSAWKDDAFRVKRQAARFQIFEVPDDGSPARPAALPVGAQVRWTVHLVNKKDAVFRPPGPPDAPSPVTSDPARAGRAIDSGAVSLAGATAARVMLSGNYLATPVTLGHAETDAAQRLVVLGGSGKSASPEGAQLTDSFYTNAGWHDDTSDGPVTAEVILPGQAALAAAPAWVIFGPPDFAPAATGVVTLYDVIREVAIEQGWLPSFGARPSFGKHIKPMIERAASLRWVHAAADWPGISLDWQKLADPSPAQKPLRSKTAVQIKSVQGNLNGFTVPETMLSALNAWVAGSFDPGNTADPVAETITRAALDNSVGQGFYPGIESGIGITDPSQFFTAPFEFRIDLARRSPGDMTALMALPWQADFVDCAGSWWPSQRPDRAPQANGSSEVWFRGFTADVPGKLKFIERGMGLGVIAPSAGKAIETGRDPALPLV
jgi:hypothetical protein